MDTATEQPITDNLWWVIPQRLGGVRKPTAAELPALKAAGVKAIISVMDDPSNLDLYTEAQLPHLWLPTQGGTAPTLEQVQQLQAFVEAQHAAGGAVVIHCTSGRRRTGTMLAAYLIRTGKAWAEALEIVQTANPEAELRAAQVAFLQTLEPSNSST